MPRVFITGSSGFLGLYLLKYSPEDVELIAQYNSHNPKGFSSGVIPLHINFLKLRWKILENFHPDVIIHTAAMADIDRCEKQPEEANTLNYEVTRQLVRYASGINARLIFISTDVVFDGTKGNYSENDIPRPLNVYAETKFKSEKYILENLSNAVVVRPALFYGKALNGRLSFTEIMLQHLKAGKTMKLLSDQYRTPILIDDLAHAIWKLVSSDFQGLIHLGGNQRVNRWELGVMLCDLFQLNIDLISPVQSSELNLGVIRPLDCSLDISLARSVLNLNFADCRTGLVHAFGTG